MVLPIYLLRPLCFHQSKGQKKQLYAKVRERRRNTSAIEWNKIQIYAKISNRTSGRTMQMEDSLLEVHLICDRNAKGHPVNLGTKPISVLVSAHTSNTCILNLIIFNVTIMKKRNKYIWAKLLSIFFFLKFFTFEFVQYFLYALFVRNRGSFNDHRRICNINWNKRREDNYISKRSSVTYSFILIVM